MDQGPGFSGVGSRLAGESVADKNRKASGGPGEAAAPIMKHAERDVFEELLPHAFRREVEQFANVPEGKWPAAILGKDPVIGIEVELAFERAVGAVKPAQIVACLAQDARREVVLGLGVFQGFHGFD